jgi:hypothetical protein
MPKIENWRNLVTQEEININALVETSSISNDRIPAQTNENKKQIYTI